jgi:uncharacterized protein with HEPN domain
MSKDNAYLTDILNAAKAIERFLQGVSKEAFLANEEKCEAVCRKLEIIGEAARRLSPEARAQFPSIPWNPMSGMRNILIHDYGEVDLGIVWDTTQRDIPRLIAELGPYLAKLPPPPGLPFGPQ